MTTGIGEKIKYYRIQANMTQEELATDIVSVSYLSKIEHGTAEANRQVINKLCDKLNITPFRMKDNIVIDLCKRWYKEILFEETDKALATFDILHHDIEKIIDADLHWISELHRLQYNILLEDYEEATKIFDFLKQYVDRFRHVEKYYWYKFSGCFYYMVDSSYMKAYGQFKRAEQLIDQEIAHYQQELHDLYYYIAKVSTSLYFTYHTMIYIEKALTYFRNTYQLKRCACSQVIKGIAYKRMNEVKQAEHSLELAMSIIDENNDAAVIAMGNRHLGELYQKSGQPTKALDYFHYSYQVAQENGKEEQLRTILGFIKVYIEKRDLEQAKSWYEKAENLIQEMNRPPMLVVFEIKTYYYLIYGYDRTFEELLEKEILPFLEQKELYKEYAQYMNMLGDYYYENRKYKIASQLYQNAFRAITSIQIKDNL
ncbi:helix-turn-helix domain-containing protein [Paraliobacillus ryukyuensis]|uniref:helix-turn-helix domain-containing protein n=1 Tax=Paraliobacillus ryukyuensis TaxID=200904 RepID=UPI0009A7EFDA|nr:helix-turn-helix transcriptional regulator [Paraliobacillus ryukyuensis]